MTETNAIAPADQVRALLEKMKPQMALAMPKHLTPERLVRVALTAVRNTPKLLECNRMSLLSAVMSCAQLGLEPDGVLGQAYLVPFKKNVQMIVGYKGYLLLARNSGEISSIQAHEVRENDHFEYRYGLQEALDHVPGTGDRGKITHFYAYARFKDGGYIFEVMTAADIDAIRDNSEGYRAFKSGLIKSNPWSTHYEAMGRKTAIRRIAKYLPLSVQRAAALDAAYDSGRHGAVDEYGDIVLETGAEELPDPTDVTERTKSKLDQIAGPVPVNPPKYTHESAVELLRSKRAEHTLNEAWEDIKANWQGDLPDSLEQAYHKKLEALGVEPEEISAPSLASLMGNLNEAKTTDEATELLDLGRALPNEQKTELLAAYEAKCTELSGGRSRLFSDEA